MVGISLLIYYVKGSFENSLQYLTYGVYLAGIIWALNDFKKSAAENKTFKNYFSEGFRCFIVVALIMVAFTFLFMKLHPEIISQMGESYRKELSGKGNYTPAEIEQKIVQGKKYYIAMLVSGATFWYLAMGALITLAGSIVLLRKK